ncbi:MAG: hypothetical protein ACREN1_01315 [Candidatus Dormibacteria bacterium]
MTTSPDPGAVPTAGGPTESDRYPNLGTKGISVSSSSAADVPIGASRTEGWLVATALLLAGCISMGIYLVVLHH